MAKQRSPWGSKKALHAALKRLREDVLNRAIAEKYGICWNLTQLLDLAQDGGYAAVAKYQETWPLTTGSTDTPIPNSYQHPRQPKWEGEQLALRLSLINHMIRSTR